MTHWNGLDGSKTQLLYSSPYLVDSITLPEKKPWQDKSVLHQKYVVEGRSMAHIGKEFLYSKNGIRAALIRFGIPIRKAAVKGRNSNINYGQRLVSGRRIEHQAEQRVIQTVVDMRKEGLSYDKIAAFLSKIQVPTKKKGQKWHHEVVRLIYLRATEKEKDFQ